MSYEYQDESAKSMRLRLEAEGRIARRVEWIENSLLALLYLGPVLLAIVLIITN